MAKEEKRTLTPRLRFPEFREGKGWEKTPLSSVLTEDKLKSDGKPEVHSVSLTKGVVPQVEHLGRSFSAADTSHYSLVRPFDVIYTKSPLAIFKLGIVKQHRGPHNALVSPLYGVFSPINRYVGQLIEAYFDAPSRNFRYLDPLAQKGAKNTIQISNEKFLSGEIFLPEDEREQQKIAGCLRSLDELIAAQGRQVDALKTFKNGLMKQLFPREGETVPRLRFPEFRDADAWKECALKDVVRSFKTGKLDANAMVDDGPYRFYTCAKSYYRIDRYAFDGEALLIAGNGAHLGYIHHYSGKFNAYQRTYVLQDFSANVVFLKLSLERNLPSRIRLEKKDGNTPYIVLATLTDMLLLIPVDISEQQRIADCLSGLDSRIAAETEKLKALKTHKKGLMHQLFPSPESV